MILLEAKDINKSYKVGNKEIKVLNHVNFSLNEGERVAIIGPSGSGKSTLLNIMSGLTKADSGTIIFKENNLSEMNDNQIAKLRLQSFGFIFQSFHLVQTLNVLDNIILPILAKKDTIPIIFESSYLETFNESTLYSINEFYKYGREIYLYNPITLRFYCVSSGNNDESGLPELDIEKYGFKKASKVEESLLFEYSKTKW